jgi:hypothetical protein
MEPIEGISSSASYERVYGSAIGVFDRCSFIESFRITSR